MNTREIEIDFAQAKRQASELRDTAEQIERLATRDFQSVLEDIMQAWQGESAAAYLAKAEQVKTRLLQTAKQLRQAAEQVRSKAEQIYRAEMEAARIAREREHAFSAGGDFGGGGGGGFGF